MGSRSTWNGTVTFGLLTIPVGLYTAVREQDLSFKQLCPAHSAPIQMKRFCTEGQEEVAYGDLVKGYEVGPGDFVVLREEDFEHAARPIPRTFDLQVFVSERDVDLRFFHTPYFVVPKAEGARTYALLREAIRRAGKVGIGRIALKTKQQIAALRVLGASCSSCTGRTSWRPPAGTRSRIPSPRRPKSSWRGSSSPTLRAS
jgi:DNA end-binding protein Ku